jgi:hypothetical protein
MKKYTLILFFTLTALFTLAPTQQSHAIIWKVVTEAAKKVLRAIDLRIQKLQNKTIGLQNTQKEIENVFSKLKLKEISTWAEKQRAQYQLYYDELKKVKTAISTYQRVRQIIERQLQLVKEYKHFYGLFKNDKHFSKTEIDYMYNVYNGMLEESARNLDQLLLAINSFSTQMSDGKRLELIADAADKIDNNLSDLRKFNTQNARISLQRSKDLGEVKLIRALYGLQ